MQISGIHSENVMTYRR